MSLARFSVENRVMVNLAMVAVLLGGLLLALSSEREFFPEVRADKVSVSVIYPGASPADVEKSVVKKIENAIHSIDGIEEITSVSKEGGGTVIAALERGVDTEEVRREIQIAVDAIRDEMPADVEDPLVVSVEPMIPVISIALYGELPERVMKEEGERLRDRVLDIELPSGGKVSQVKMGGTRKYEMRVEMDPDRLLEYNVTSPTMLCSFSSVNTRGDLCQNNPE